MIQYQCPKCEWTGTEKEMDSDSHWCYNEAGEVEDELWSNCVCPQCGTWHQLEDYKTVEK
jgi:predicted RNA-binding Zn-ribbon protein involved in translation (DUF1610 family)